jgi:hypothetical protein
MAGCSQQDQDKTSICILKFHEGISSVVSKQDVKGQKFKMES